VEQVYTQVKGQVLDSFKFEWKFTMTFQSDQLMEGCVVCTKGIPMSEEYTGTLDLIKSVFDAKWGETTTRDNNGGRIIEPQIRPVIITPEPQPIMISPEPIKSILSTPIKTISIPQTNGRSSGLTSPKKSFFKQEQKKCVICMETVFKIEQVEVENRVYHQKCFKCVKCKRNLNVGNFAFHSGNLYCLVHHKEVLFTSPIVKRK
jgi:hypothetical protein